MSDANEEKPCTFCGEKPLLFAFVRGERRYFRCENCRAVIQMFEDDGAKVRLYDKYEEGDFSISIEENLGDKPDYAGFDEVKRYLKPGKLLEIGPGTGHFLAAARSDGLDVFGIEISPYQRRYIREKWGIETLADPIEQNRFDPKTFDSVASFNCIEHVADPKEHFRAVFRTLKPSGRFLVVTQNSGSLLARFAGRYWAMFKPQDHLSIPSPRSLRLVGESTGFKVVKIWCSEFPLETPLGFVVALRDLVADLRSKNGNASDRPADVPPNRDLSNDSKIRRIGRQLIRSKSFSWVSAITSRFMVAATVIALYEKP